MGQAAQKTVFTATDYLVWESGQLERHEFLDGEVFAMAGAEDRHVTVSMNLAFALRQHLSGSPCRTFMSDMRLHVAAANSYFYPDVLVTCSALDLASPMVKTEPKLIAEVLSPSTAAYDRGLKFSHYRSLASLEEYLVIDLDTRRIATEKVPTGCGCCIRLRAARLFCWPAWRWNSGPRSCLPKCRKPDCYFINSCLRPSLLRERPV